MMTKEQIFNEFYNKAYDNLLEKAKKLNIDKNELEGYFDPISQKHIDYYNRRFNLALVKENIENNVIEYQNFLFMRFVSSLLNKGNEYYITNNDVEKQLAELLNKFDLDNFLNFTKFDEFEKIVNNDKFNLLIEKRYSKNVNKNGNKTDYLKTLYDSMISVAIHIKEIIAKNKVYMKKAADYLDFKQYMGDVKELISYKIAKPLKGMQITLLADAIKESGMIDVMKPDRHVQNTMHQIFDLGDNTDKVDDLSFERILNIFYDISKACGQSIYKIDKIIYMYCAQGNNGFYMSNIYRSDRDKLIENLRSIPGISNLEY